MSNERHLHRVLKVVCRLVQPKALAVPSLSVGSARAGEINADSNEVVIKGYDTVAYFTISQAVRLAYLSDDPNDLCLDATGRRCDGATRPDPFECGCCQDPRSARGARSLVRI